MNTITEFIDAFIPRNLPKARKNALKTELENHLLDKTDYYREIGYDEEESIKKAIADFGTDEKLKKNIFNEFETLYSEKKIYGIVTFFAIIIMNYLCIPLDLWVISADSNHDPEPFGVFMSFCMIYTVSMAIIFARVKKYRKMLFSIGFACTMVAAFLLFSFFPQNAAYAITYNLIYIIDVFTPFSVWDFVNSYVGTVIIILWEAFLIISAIYCFFSSVRIKKGAAKTIKKRMKKTVAFSVVFFVFTTVTCLLWPTSQAYFDDYPVWFTEYDNHISEESEDMFGRINIGEDYGEVSSMLHSEGYTSIISYEKSLDKLALKQFKNNLKEFVFEDGYEIWFNPDRDFLGNGFVGLKIENGVITAKGIGNLNKNMYDGDYCNFGYTSIESNDDIFGMTEYFRGLRKGDSEAEIMSRFGIDFGEVYSKRFSLENGIQKNYYRIYCYGEVNSEAKQYYDKDESRYIELSFENGKLTGGAIYTKHYTENGTSVTVEYMNRNT